jgi:hypothetical protein
MSEIQWYENSRVMDWMPSCIRCGAFIANQRTHDIWHDELDTP